LNLSSGDGRVKKFLILAAKITISVLILGYLFWNAATAETPDGQNIFTKVLHEPKRWDLLAAAWCLGTLAVVLTLVRWWYLVRALGIKLTLRDALRIGFLGYLFNLAPMGIVGGDLLKVVMLSREYPGNRAKSLASVMADRIIGLYVLFVVASAGILVMGYWQSPVREIRVTCQVVLALTAVGTAGICFLLIPGVLSGPWAA
jgi:uncharacterized membrane protein YbhN (UPF0104 family)